MKSFDDLGLNSVLNKSLAHMKYTTPTPIQAKAIPIALDGRDILGSAQTGTGKTAAFAIPLVEALLNDERKCALVMTPTRELGRQVMEIMHQLLGHQSGIKTAFLIGGESMSKQYAQLKRRPRLIVGTPGRINDHVERRNLHLDQTRFLVLDETDRMLDMGFSIQIDKIVRHIPNDRQTLLFSATMPKNIIKMADKYQTNPERIAIGSSVNVAENIDQKIIKLDQDKKYDILREELEARQGSVIIFVKTKRNADKLARKLKGDDYHADAIHGDLKQSKRERVIKAYRSKGFRILVATDVVSRGLDVPHVAHVINYDLPQVPEDYIHRIGRTARAGAKGEALCFVTPQDGRKWHAIEQMLYPDKKLATPANDGKKGKGRGKSSFRKKPHRGKSGDSAERREDRPYKGKRSYGDRDNEGKPQKKRHFKDGKPNDSRSEGRDYSRDRSESSERSNEGRPYKGKRDFSENRNSDSRRSNEGRNSSRDRSESGERSNEGRPYKGKRDFSENRNSDSRRSNEGRSFSRDKTSTDEKKFVGKQTNRSRNFSDGEKGGNGNRNDEQRREGRPYKGKRSYGDRNNEGQPQNKRHFKDGKPNESRSEGRDYSKDRSASGERSNEGKPYKGKRSFSGGKAKPAHKNDGSQPRRANRPSGDNKFSGGNNGKTNRAA